MKTPTGEERDIILRRSAEAQAFLHSFLYQELDKWIKTEQMAAFQVIIYDSTEGAMKELPRDRRIEQMAGYVKGLQQILGTVREFANQESQLQKIEEATNESTAK